MSRSIGAQVLARRRRSYASSATTINPSRRAAAPRSQTSGASNTTSGCGRLRLERNLPLHRPHLAAAANFINHRGASARPLHRRTNSAIWSKSAASGMAKPKRAWWPTISKRGAVNRKIQRMRFACARGLADAGFEEPSDAAHPIKSSSRPASLSARTCRDAQLICGGYNRKTTTRLRGASSTKPQNAACALR